MSFDHPRKDQAGSGSFLDPILILLLTGVLVV